MNDNNNLNNEVQDNDLEKKDEVVESKEEDKSLELIEEVEATEEETKETEEEALPPMDAIVEIETTYDYKTLKYANMYVIKVKRKSGLISIIMASISIIIGIVIAFIGQDNSKWIICAIVVALGLWTLYNLFTEETKIDKTLQKYFSTHPVLVQTFAIDDERIRVSAVLDGKLHQADYSWPYIQEINAIPEYYLLFLNNGSPLILDRNPMACVKGTQDDLDKIMKEKGELKPFRHYDKPVVKKLIDISYYQEVVNNDEEITTVENENNEKEESKDDTNN